jgi:ribosomal protein S14
MKFNRYKNDLKKRKLHKKTEIFQKTLKLLFLYSSEMHIKLITKKNIYFKLLKNCFKSRVKNYCVISGRGRSIYKKLKVSRIVFKSLNNEGFFFGIRKTS